MIAASVDAAAGTIAAPEIVRDDVLGPIGERSFASAMADMSEHRPLFRVSAISGASAPPTPELRVLARHLDEIGRRRVQAQSISDELAGSWTSGADVQQLAVAMHRQARAMASYNLSVMWGAKLVGVTAGALRQLTTAT